MKNKKGFTLIELLAVLVVLAILALISIPITIRIIESARENSYKRSIANYAKTFEMMIARDNMGNAKNDYDLLNNYKNNMDDQYMGNRVHCAFSPKKNTDDNYSTLIEGRLKLRGCKVNDDTTEYKYTNGKVEKESVYDEYKVGDTVTLNGVQYYVISESTYRLEYVTLLKAEPLTNDEVRNYGGVGTENNHVNRYKSYSQGRPYDQHGYGGMLYYSSEQCGYVNSQDIENDCTTDYDRSDIKYVVDAWAADNFQNDELALVNGYKARLIKIEDFLDNFDSSKYYSSTEGIRYRLIINSGQADWSVGDLHLGWYWTMSSYNGNKIYYSPYNTSSLTPSDPTFVLNPGAVRPVINVYKNAIEE